MTPRKPKQSLETFAERQLEARFNENQEIARANRMLRSALGTRDQELGLLRQRLAEYEHPSLSKVERLLAKRQSLSAGEISAELDISLEDANRLLRDMTMRGYNVVDGVVSRQGGGRKVEVEHF